MSGNGASSNSRDSGELQLDRENYPYFTEDEFNIFSVEGINVMKTVHLSCKKRFEKRIANFDMEFDKPSHLEKELKIVLCGKTGSGKSSTANAILGEEIFKASRSSNSVTNVSLDNTCTYKHRSITVVDTPGIHDTGSENEIIVKELARMAFLLQGGVHCFVICMSASDTRFTQDIQEMLDCIEQDGQGNFFDYCMLAYTKAETELETCTLREFLEEKKENEDNRCFLEEINDRVVAVNNTCLVPAEVMRHRDALIDMADFVVAENRQKGNPVLFTNDLFLKAKTLHEEITSVVESNDLCPTLINAMIEAIVNKCDYLLPFDDFLDEVVSILKMRKTSEKTDRITDLFINETTNVKYVHQVKQIYDAIQTEYNNFITKFTSLVLAVVGAVGGRGAVATAIEILGVYFGK